MLSVESAGSAPPFQAFTVLIPRPLQRSVEGLPTEVRQALLAELFRLAALAQERRGALAPVEPCVLHVELAGCMARVELDGSRSRLTLVKLRCQARQNA